MDKMVATSDTNILFRRVPRRICSRTFDEKKKKKRKKEKKTPWVNVDTTTKENSAGRGKTRENM